MTAYLSRLAARLRVVSSGYDDRGALHFGTENNLRGVQQRIDTAAADIQKGTAHAGNYHIDPVAFSDLGSVLALARARSRRLVVFYPPMPESILAVSSTDFSYYRETVNSRLDPGTLVLDFNVPEYKSFRENTGNFIDEVHLSQQGAKFVVSELQKTIDDRFDQRASTRQ